MEQQRALNALEPYVALSKSASSPRAAADLVMQATSAPQTYIFAELLQTPNIQALAQSPEYASHLRLLEIFAWGSYEEYKATPNLPALTPAQTQKLQLLSLLPLLSSPTTLTYAALMHALALPTTQALESLITTAIYASLVTASLDPLHQTVRVTSVAPLRDLPPGAARDMLAVLGEWEGRCADTLGEIEGKIAKVRADALRDRQRQMREEAVFEAELGRMEERREGLGGGGVPRGGDVRKGAAGMAQKWGSLLSGRGGKRSAPGDYESAGLGGGPVAGASDEMDLDDEDAQGPARSSKRKGLR